MGDVEVAVDDVRQLARPTPDLSGEMTGHDADVSCSRDESVHSVVIGAMDEFHRSWDDNRDCVSEKLVLAHQINEVTVDL